MGDVFYSTILFCIVGGNVAPGEFPWAGWGWHAKVALSFHLDRATFVAAATRPCAAMSQMSLRRVVPCPDYYLSHQLDNAGRAKG
jgi:hypothetical protein